QPIAARAPTESFTRVDFDVGDGAGDRGAHGLAVESRLYLHEKVDRYAAVIVEQIAVLDATTQRTKDKRCRCERTHVAGEADNLRAMPEYFDGIAQLGTAELRPLAFVDDDGVLVMQRLAVARHQVQWRCQLA